MIMEKEYYNEEKANYIIENLASATKIDKVYWPLIVDIMLRRQYQFGLNDDIFKRDVQSFVKNVKRISVEKIGDCSGQFDTINKKITLHQGLFNKEPIDFIALYETLAHECCHAMNYETVLTTKVDRAFNNLFSIFDTVGIMEVFTECEADSIALNHTKDPDSFMMRTKTLGYPNITGYFDVISACFGIDKNEILKAAITGKDELHRLFNEKMHETDDSKKQNAIFNGISFNIGVMHSQIYNGNNDLSEEQINQRNENIKNANKYIYLFAEQAINNRIQNIKADNVEEFREEFETILRDQVIVKDVIEGNFDLYQTKEAREELRNGTHGQFDIATLKLRCIDYVLENNEIEDKLGLLKSIQEKKRLSDLEIFLSENEIKIDRDKQIKVSQRKADEHNDEYTSNGMTWDNNKIVKYMQNHKKRIANPKHNRIENFKRELENVGNELIEWVEKKSTKLINIIEKLFSKSKSLPAGEETERVEEEVTEPEVDEIGTVPESNDDKPWDLSNWGLNPSDVEYKPGVDESFDQEQEGIDIDDGSWDWGEK